MNSDIDIAVQREFGARLVESKEVGLIKAEAQKKLNRNAHIFEFRIGEADEYLVNNLVNGLVLSGNLVVKK